MQMQRCRNARCQMQSDLGVLQWRRRSGHWHKPSLQRPSGSPSLPPLCAQMYPEAGMPLFYRHIVGISYQLALFR